MRHLRREHRHAGTARSRRCRGCGRRTRQPVLLDLWDGGPPTPRVFTTVGNWKQAGLDIEFRGETYRWSKHHEFLKFIDLPRRARRPIELAMNLGRPTYPSGRTATRRPGAGRWRPTTATLLTAHGWRLVERRAFTTDPWPYRDYVRASRGEFTVARDLNVRLQSGWFSERSACYLAAGRPVVTQDTGFGTVLPTGEGLFAFNTMDEVRRRLRRHQQPTTRATAGRRGRSPRSTSGPRRCWPRCSRDWGCDDDCEPVA